VGPRTGLDVVEKRNIYYLMVVYVILLDMYSNPSGLLGNHCLSKAGLYASTVPMGKAVLLFGFRRSLESVADHTCMLSRMFPPVSF
jgi:hypothetical protein